VTVYSETVWRGECAECKEIRETPGSAVAARRLSRGGVTSPAGLHRPIYFSLRLRRSPIIFFFSRESMYSRRRRCTVLLVQCVEIRLYRPPYRQSATHCG